MRRFLWFALAFGLAFDVIALFVAPRAIHAWYQPPAAAGGSTVIFCGDAISWAMSKLIQTQLLAVAIGIALAGVIAIVRRPKAEAPPPAAPPPRG